MNQTSDSSFNKFDSSSGMGKSMGDKTSEKYQKAKSYVMDKADDISAKVQDTVSDTKEYVNKAMGSSMDRDDKYKVDPTTNQGTAKSQTGVNDSFNKSNLSEKTSGSKGMSSSSDSKTQTSDIKEDPRGDDTKRQFW